MPWQRQADGSFDCLRHGSTWKAAKPSCAKCKTDPGPAVLAVEAVTVPEAPAGCMSSIERERWFSDLALAAAADAQRLADGTKPVEGKAAEVNFHAEANIVKHRELALKLGRAASDLALRREDEHIVAVRDKELEARAARMGRSH